MPQRAGQRVASPTMTAPPICPSCGQPASTALAGPEHGWECRNEACPEFGQAIEADEPERGEPPAPEPPR